MKICCLSHSNSNSSSLIELILFIFKPLSVSLTYDSLPRISQAVTMNKEKPAELVLLILRKSQN